MSLRYLSYVMSHVAPLFLLTIFFTGCDVHEFPDTPDEEPYKLRFVFNAENMHDWQILASDIPSSTRKEDLYGIMRYIIRLYPANTNTRNTNNYVKEYVVYRNLFDTYGDEFRLDLLPGEYLMRVWADIANPYAPGRSFFYDPTNFAEITLSDHVANTDFRDAFRGERHVKIEADILDNSELEVIEVMLERPLAKYEFITNDLKEFTDKEIVASRGDAPQASGSPATRLDISNYKVVFYYSGFMPDTYSMLTDKPVDSSTGRSFESVITPINENEASLGFDYIFVNGSNASVSVRVGIYNEKGTQLSLTNPIDVPLKRSHHTKLRGSYLMQTASEGIVINPDFDGEHNVVIP